MITLERTEAHKLWNQYWQDMKQEWFKIEVLQDYTGEDDSPSLRIIEKPYTPYTEWEIEFYKQVNIPGGEQIFIINKQDVADLDLPSGDLMMFDNKRVAICTYNKTGRVIQQTFHDENDDITKFLQLKHDLLPLARPLQAR